MTENKPVVLLLIDDDEDDRYFFEVALAGLDLNTSFIPASGAKAALDLLETRQVTPDFIFLDLNMPGINGRTCLTQLKSNPDTAHIPVVIYTTSEQDSDMVETRAMGAAYFMTKPPDLMTLPVLLNNFFSQQFQNNNT